MANFTQYQLKLKLIYNPETGEFRRTKSNKKAGYQRPDGYHCLAVFGNKYLAHRLAWFYVTGAWPEHEVDHVNQIRNDNRWCNLRASSKQQQMGNTKVWKNNTSRLRGVTYHKASSKWRAIIGTEHIGLYETREAAKVAYNKAAKEYFGEFYNDKH